MKKVRDPQKLLTANNEGKTPSEVLMATIDSVAPHFEEELNISHLKGIEKSSTKQ